MPEKTIGLILIGGHHGNAMRLGVGLFAQNRPNWRVISHSVTNDAYLDALKDFRGDGLIAMVYTPEVEAVVRACGCPVVSVVSGYQAEGIPFCSRDLAAAGRLAGQHFVEQGLIHGAYFATAQPVFKRICLAEHGGLSAAMSPGRPVPYFDRGPRTLLGKPWNETSQIADLAEWLLAMPKPVGVFCCDDEHGMRLLNAAAQAGLKVPEDVAVVGNRNDPSFWPLCSPPLSSVELGLPRQGYIAAEMLSELMEGRMPERTKVLLEPVGLMARGSSTRIRFEDPFVQDTLNFIQANLMEDLTLDALAKRMHCSRRTLHRRFVAAVGRSPSEVVHGARVEAALHMLTDTDYSITQITDRTGFGYASNLCRAVRKAAGCTPSEYRRRMSSPSVKGGLTGAPRETAREDGRSVNCHPSERGRRGGTLMRGAEREGQTKLP